MPESKEELKKEEAETSSDSSDDKKEPEQGDDSKKEEPSKKPELSPDVEERLKNLEEENKKIKEDNENYKTALKAFKDEKKREKIQITPTQEKVQDDDEGDFEKEEERKIEKVFDKREAQQQQGNFDKAVEKFHEKYPQYAPENDFGDINWRKIEPKIKAHSFKGSVEDMLEDLEILHHGITRDKSPTSPESKTEEVEDSGVGSVTGLPGGKEKEDDIMTRKLNKAEQEACRIGVESGTYKNEKEYREALLKESGK